MKQLPDSKSHIHRLLKSLGIGTLMLGFSLSIGVLGYHYLFHISWIDGLVNASMILTGMGPVDKAETDEAKIFSSVYAIYSGVAFLTSVAVIVSPIVHRFLHKFHLEVEE